MEAEFRAELVKLLPRLQRFAYALTGSLDQGDDLVQAACLRAIERMHQWTPGTRLDSWVFKIQHNMWLDRKRAEKVRGDVINVDGINDIAGLDGRDVVENRQELDTVIHAIARLPEDQQAVVALVCIDGLSYKEAAAIADVPIGTVMSRLSRARATLYDAINPKLPKKIGMQK